MALESSVVFRNDYQESSFWMLDFDQFQDFQIIIVNFICQRKWTNIDDINIRVLDWKQSCNLSVLLLFIFLNRHPLNFWNRKWIDVYFSSFLCFYYWPLLLELILHLIPNFHLVLSQFLQLFICFAFEQIKSITPLNNWCFFHEVFQLLEIAVWLVSFPYFLDQGCC